VPPGVWRLTVTHPDYPTWERTIEIPPGGSKRQVVQLATEVLLRGVIEDRFGQPRTGEQVWLLRPSERHPARADEARGTVNATAGRRGRFELIAPEAGRWKVTVGPIGEMRLSAPPTELHHGGPDRLRIVMAGASLLEVRCVVEGRELGVGTGLTARVLQRAVDDERSARGSEEGTAPVVLPGTPPVREDASLRPPIAERVPPEWVVHSSLRVGTDGVARFRYLPTGIEFRLGIYRSTDRFESDASFQLAPDERLILHAQLPKEEPAPPEGLPAQPLAMEQRTLRLGADERPAGIFWE